MAFLKPFVVVGTRPEIIKMAPVVHECERRGIEAFLLHTGQHYSNGLSGKFFRDMNLREPDRNLEIGSGTHSEQTAKALVGIEKEILREEPDAVLVEGDTNAVLSAALAAVKLGVPVGHVEAGLRSYDIRMPEEHNRRLTDHVSSFLFAPTEKSAQILREEQVWGEVTVTGNTVIDALEESLPAAAEVESEAERLGLDEFVLLTIHRAENVDDRTILSGLVEGLLSMDEDIIYVTHPRTRERLNRFGLMRKLKSGNRIHIVEPQGYLEFLALMRDCKYVMTDSGGIQEEVTAPSLNKKVFVLRISTERPEAVESGHATVVGVDSHRFPELIRHEVANGLDSKRSSPYGEGNASHKIVDVLQNRLAV